MDKKHIICLRWTPTQREMCQCNFALIKLSAEETCVEEAVT